MKNKKNEKADSVPQHAEWGLSEAEILIYVM